MKSNLAKNLMTFAVSVFVGLILCEAIVRLFIPVRNVGPCFSEYDLYYGRKLKKNFSCIRYTPEFTMRVTTNSLGFRGPEIKNIPEKSLIFIGDSFTMGYGVNDGEEFPALVRLALEEKYGKDSICVINTGIAGIGNGWWLKFLKKDAKLYNPSLVVLTFCCNDFANNIERELYHLENDKLVAFKKMSYRKLGRKALVFIEKIPGISYSYLFGLLRQAENLDFGKKDDSQPGQNEVSSLNIPYEESLTYSILRETLKICKEENISVIAVNTGVKDSKLREIEQIWKMYNVPFINIPTKKDCPDLYYLRDSHWNANGHRFVADQIMDKLLTEFEELLTL